MGTHVEVLADPAGVPEELLCSICTGVFLDPQACPCGHRFCDFCVREWFEHSGKTCPLCRADVQASTLTECSELRAKCDAFEVRCPWRCGWRGQRRELASHSTQCSVAYFTDLTVELSGGGSLDIGLEMFGDLVLVGSVKEGGVVWQHNQSQPNEERRIRVNDQLVMVDGVESDPAFLLYLVQRPGRRTVTFRHPDELACSIRRRSKEKLGLDLHWLGPNGNLTVLDVDARKDERDDGAAPSQHGLIRHDRIIEVNGVDCLNNPDNVVPMLLESEEREFVFKVHRPRRKSVCSL